MYALLPQDMVFQSFTRIKIMKLFINTIIKIIYIMGEYVSMVSGTRQYQEAKLWVYQSRNHLKRASKERSNRSIPALKAKKKGGNAMYQPSFIRDACF